VLEVLKFQHFIPTFETLNSKTMLLEKLSLSHWIDLREAVTRRLNDVRSADPFGTEAKQEQQRRSNSLEESLKYIEAQIRVLQTPVMS